MRDRNINNLMVYPSTLEDVSRLPFNNFTHFLTDMGFDVNSFLGVENYRFLIGGNCIYKTQLAANILQQVYSRIYSIVDLGGFHHSLLAYDSTHGMAFFDGCLFMPSCLHLNSSFECVETVFSSGESDANFVAIDLDNPMCTQVLWRFEDLHVSKSFTFSYDLLVHNAVAIDDGAVEQFKSIPNSLILRYLSSTGSLMHLSFFIRDRKCYLSRAFFNNFQEVSQLSKHQVEQFKFDVGLELNIVEELMYKACEYMCLSKRFLKI